MENNAWLSISAIVFSGVSSVILTIIVQRKHRLYDLRYDVLVAFVENRFDLQSDEFTKAMNKIYIIYGKKKKVIKTLMDFQKSLTSKQSNEEANEKLWKVYIEMCRAVRICPMEQNLFYNPFNAKII